MYSIYISYSILINLFLNFIKIIDALNSGISFACYALK